jgi:hypothetical protein
LTVENSGKKKAILKEKRKKSKILLLSFDDC